MPHAGNPYAKVILKGGVVGVKYEITANFGLACSAFNTGAVAKVLGIKRRNLAGKRFPAIGDISLIPQLVDWEMVPANVASYLGDIKWLEDTFAGKGFLRFPVRKDARIPPYMTSSLKGLPANNVEALLLGERVPKIVQVWMCTLLCRYEHPVFQLLNWPPNSVADRMQMEIKPFHLVTSMNISGEPSIRTLIKAGKFCKRAGIPLFYLKDRETPREQLRGEKRYFVVSITREGWKVIRHTNNLPSIFLKQ